MKLTPTKHNGKMMVEFLGNRYPVDPGQTSVKIDGVVFPIEKPKVESVTVKDAASQFEPKVVVKKTTKKTKKTSKK